MPEIRYVSQPGTFLVRNAGDQPNSAGSVQLLLGARLHVEPADAVNGFLPATDMRDADGDVRTGFVDETLISNEQQLKIFYLDVGQADATLIEAEGAIVIIDGGPNVGFKKALDERLRRLRMADKDVGLPERKRLTINAVVVSHFDEDHYAGIGHLLKSDDYESGPCTTMVCRAMRTTAARTLPWATWVNHNDGTSSISTDLSDLDSAQALVDSGLLVTPNGNDNDFSKFLQAALKASDDKRLGEMKRLVRRDATAAVEHLDGTGPDMRFEVLGPLTTKTTGTIRLPTFSSPHKAGTTPSESHTVNGNSIVLRLIYRDRHFLFGGDLNQPAQAFRRRVGLEARLAVRYANGPAILTRRAAGGPAKDPHIELQIRVVACTLSRSVRVRLGRRRHVGPLFLGRQLRTPASPAAARLGGTSTVSTTSWLGGALREHERRRGSAHTDSSKDFSQHHVLPL